MTSNPFKVTKVNMSLVEDVWMKYTWPVTVVVTPPTSAPSTKLAEENTGVTRSKGLGLFGQYAEESKREKTILFSEEFDFFIFLKRTPGYQKKDIF